MFGKIQGVCFWLRKFKPPRDLVVSAEWDYLTHPSHDYGTVSFMVIPAH
jgi:hypothetical protein